jgi:branched-chain amino acid transport system permease protein
MPLVQAIGVATDIAVMSLLALSAYLLLLVGRISHWPLVAALAAGAAVGAFASALVAWPTMRLPGLHYAVATLAFGEMARTALQAWHWQVERDGVAVGPAGSEGFRDIRWLLENNVSPVAFLAVVLAAVFALMQRAERMRIGVALRAVGHDDTLAAAAGLPVARLRLLAATVAGALAALGGGLYAHRATYVEPALFDPMLGVHAVGYALIGGLGTALGPILGVVFDLGLLEATRVFAGWRMVVFGGLVALFLRFRPRGLLDEALMHRLRLTWPPRTPRRSAAEATG